MRGNPYVFSDFRAGVNLPAAPYSLDSGQTRESWNVHSSVIGSIKKRNGCITLKANTEEYYHSLFGVNLAEDILIAGLKTKLYKISTTGIATEIKSGLTNNATWEFIQAPISGGQGPVWGVNGVDTPQYWDGVSGATGDWTASSGSIPNGKLIAYHENRVYIAKDSTLYWSDITDPRNFESPKGGSTKFDPEDGQEITALGKIGPYLLVFKNRKVFVMYDSNTGAYRRISDAVGCISPRTVVETERGTFFLSSDNEIIVTDGQTFTNVGTPVQPLLDLVSGPLKTKGCAVEVGDIVYYSVSTNGSYNDILLEYNLSEGSWWPHKIQVEAGGTTGVNQFVLLDPSNTSTLYAIGAKPTQSHVLKCFQSEKFTDSLGEVYPAFWISPWHVFTYPHLRKLMREIRVDAKGTFDLSTNRSFFEDIEDEETTNWEIAGEGTIFGGEGKFGEGGTFGDKAAIVEKRFYTPGVGRAWSLRFESSTVQDLEIYSYTCAINYKKD